MEQFDSLISTVRENPRRSSENEQIRILLERQKEQILAAFEQRLTNKSSKPIKTEEVFKKLNEMIESQRGESYRSHQGDEQLRRDEQLIHEQLLEQIRDLREAHEKTLNEMEELKRFLRLYIRSNFEGKSG